MKYRREAQVPTYCVCSLQRESIRSAQAVFVQGQKCRVHQRWHRYPISIFDTSAEIKPVLNVLRNVEIDTRMDNTTQPQELGGVMHRFDKNGDGTVDVVEFTKAFFKMGFDERSRRTKERREAEAVRKLLQTHAYNNTPSIRDAHGIR